MNSPKTPTNAGTGGNGDANAEPTPPTSVFKRMAGWLIGGSAKKRQRLATPTNTSNAVIANGHHQRQPTETTAPVSLGNDNDNGVAGTASSVLQPAISPLFSPLPPRKPMQKTSTSTSTAAFTIGHNKTKGLTNPSFKRIQFAAGSKLPSISNYTAPASTSMSTPARVIKYRKATPFQKRQRDRVNFQANTTTTPARRKAYATTPYKSSSATATATPNAKFNANSNASAGFTPYRRSGYKPTSSILMSSTSKLSTLSKNKSRMVAKQILSKQMKANLTPKQTDDALFQDPTKVQTAGVRRIYGRNQDGSRIQSSPSVPTNGNGNGDGDASNVIRDRRESAKKGAFIGEPTAGGDYWSNVESNVASPNATNGHMAMAMTTPRQAHAALEDGTAPSTKRKKVSFQSLTPPGGMSSKDAARTVDVTSDSDDKARMPTMSTPFKVHQEPKCVTLGLDVEDERREGGVLVYPMEKVYGQNLDYKKMLGESSKGVPDNEDTRNALATAMREMKNGNIPMIKFYKKRDAAAIATSESSASDKNVNAGSKALPFDFMPKTPSSSRKGSSSILNKPTQNTGNGDNAATTPAPVNATGATPATESSPVPAGTGWGNIFKKKPGEWRCNVCSCANIQEDANCLSCEAPKGSEAEAPKPSEDANASTGSNEAEKKESGFSVVSGSNIAFGASTSSDKKDDFKPETGGFTFGTTPSAENEAKPATGGFTFGAPSSSSDKKDDSSKPASGGFTFGSTPSAASDKKDEAKPTGGFTFGAPSSSSDKKDDSSKPTSGGFTFGSTPSAASEKKDEAKPTGGFTFGAPSSSSDKKEESKSTTGGFSFGSTTPAPASSETKDDGIQKQNISFGSIPASEPVKKSGTTPAFQFGSKRSATEASAPSMAFGSIPSKKDDAPSEQKRKTRSADDGDSSKQVAAPTFTFGGSSTTAPVPAPAAAPTTTTPAFTFGSKKGPEVAATGNSNFGFGPSATSAPASGPAFSFGASSNTAPAATASSSASISPIPGSSAAFSFGSSSTSTPAPAASSGGFPGPAAPAPSGGASFAFGQPSSTAPAAQAAGGSTFAFGSSAPTPAAPAPAAVGNSFFGAPAPSAPPVAFGSAAAPSSTGFGGQPVAPPQQPAAPAFGFGAQAPAAPAAPTQFGAPAAPTQFGAPAPSAGFGFGQAQAPVMGAPSAGVTGGFSIGKSDGGRGNKGKRRIIRAKRPQPR
jgi:hypothetical protein